VEIRAGDDPRQRARGLACGTTAGHLVHRGRRSRHHHEFSRISAALGFGRYSRPTPRRSGRRGGRLRPCTPPDLRDRRNVQEMVAVRAPQIRLPGMHGFCWRAGRPVSGQGFAPRCDADATLRRIFATPRRIFAPSCAASPDVGRPAACPPTPDAVDASRPGHPGDGRAMLRPHPSHRPRAKR
jgi:hypothetical protein